ncbi:MAG: metalloregulator ArsR/SmtB family transcription factor [SAR324 cluster bacterium]|jgi:DNA-binding transcriptional ArsR family regulator|nr:transcriptional regulator [Pseudomonadota bacterium]MBP43235.1 transcriptional regulator [Deltaproteobacteria bacterium]MDP6092394.1 metalloregulator ArsR/SmtB family transcription factor [SAR324 cluster bacterium]MDP6568410.1 metalloregulator ArsR/SmtB family transcription factor [Candidatus Neomarinimicrobiota bacterium]MDP6248154.1 metalloregulator ArsR/SmtB family transcription factor [SAR324 cluster bacterium]|tara:strand:+ start:1837 stop:2166 length:330 start_codon:yes stop_codon:yes gene_type:complete
MELQTAADTLAQLGNPTRLEVVRCLVKAGPSGMTVGSIQKQLDIPASTLTHHLKHLKEVGLLVQKREKTILWCSIDYQRLNEISVFLVDECCSFCSKEFGNEKTELDAA